MSTVASFVQKTGSPGSRAHGEWHRGTACAEASLLPSLTAILNRPLVLVSPAPGRAAACRGLPLRVCLSHSLPSGDSQPSPVPQQEKASGCPLDCQEKSGQPCASLCRNALKNFWNHQKTGDCLPEMPRQSTRECLGGAQAESRRSAPAGPGAAAVIERAPDRSPGPISHTEPFIDPTTATGLLPNSIH